MKKTIIALAVASAVAAPMTANAAAKVYGQVQAEITNSANTMATGSSKFKEGMQMSDNARGRFGLKGSEDLGNGLTMIGKMEYKMDTADGDSSGTGISLTKREMFVGMKAGWGTIMMGRVKSPYKYNGGVKYDVFVTTALQSRGVTMSGKAGQGKAQGHNSFMSDTVALRFGALQVNLGVDEASGTSGDLTLGYKMKMGKNEVIFAHTASSLDAATGSKDYTATKVGGKFGAVKAQFETTDAAGTKDTFLFVSYGMKMGGGKLILQGGTASGDSYADDLTDLTIGYVKKYSKKARLFAGLRSTTGSTVANAGNLDNTIATVGLRFDY